MAVEPGFLWLLSEFPGANAEIWDEFREQPTWPPTVLNIVYRRRPSSRIGFQ